MMTEYKYRWVRLFTPMSQNLDYEHVRDIEVKGWQLAPVDDPMLPEPNLGNDKTKVRPTGMALYRMPIEVANERERLAVAANRRLGDTCTHLDLAAASIAEFKQSLRDKHGPDAGKGWGPIIGEGTACGRPEMKVVRPVIHWRTDYKL